MSPLNKRLPRELLHNLGKYLGLFLMLVFAVSISAGFLSTSSSLQILLDESPERYNIEDLHFATQFEMKKSDVEAVEAMGGTLYEDFYADVPLRLAGNERDITVRLIQTQNRESVNMGYYFEGEPPASAREIALDRVFCANNDVHVGDTITVNGHEVTVSGIMSLSDYLCLMEKNTDLMFNSITFSVSLVSEEGFEELTAGKEEYRYDMVLDNRDMDLVERTALEEDLAKLLTDRGIMLTDMVDIDSNMARFFVTDDIEGDSVMWEVLMAILIVIMAFVFVVLTDATIEQESAVIGTLLASGYRRSELVCHYMVLPTLTGLIGGIVGNVLGYTVMSGPMQDLEYNSYSLPPFVSMFDVRAFVITTVIPFVLLVSITFLGLTRKLGATPLAFLRQEVSHKKRRTKLVLPERLGFVARFRIRVFMRNVSHFVVLFFGIAFCSLFLLFGLCMMPLVDHYVEELQYDVVADHLYMLKTPLEIEGTPAERKAWAAAEALAVTKNPEEVFDLGELLGMAAQSMTIDEDDHPVNTKENSEEAIAQAEKFTAYTLVVPRVYTDTFEDVTVYGIEPDSRYWKDLDVGDGKLVLGTGLATKCKLEVGDVIPFTDKYTNDEYALTATSVWGSSANTNVYLSLADFNQMFENDEDYFSGYASNEELALNQRYLATDVTPESMASSADQMQDSMGEMMDMMLYMAIPIYLILVYLLTKTVIDRSARYISYMKVFGYRNREITKLYVRSITVTVLVSLVLSLPFVIWLIKAIVPFVMDRYSGNLEIYIQPYLLGEIVAIGAMAYLVIAAIHVWRIRHVPLALAMKIQE